MKIRFILIMALLLTVVFFTLQNTELVAVRFLLWEFQLSRALLIFLAFTVGVIVGLFMGSTAKCGKEKPPTIIPPTPKDAYDRNANP